MESQHADKHTFPCESCGSSLSFKPGTTALECPHCGHRQEIDAGGEVAENDLRDALKRARRARPAELVDGGHTIRCEGCGAETVITGQSDHCAFCGSPVVVAVEGGEALHVPDSVLPFKIERRDAKARFDGWVGGLWFAPSALKKRAETQGMDGVYIPYWTFDSQSTTRYRGERGEHYYVTETYRDSEGKEQTRQVQKTRWHAARGTVKVPFDDVLVCASETLPDKLIRKLWPWDLKDLKPYTPAFLSGFITERYKVSLEDGWRRGQELMQTAIEAAIRRDIGGDEQRISTMDIRHASVTFKHCLLPLWISSFRFDGKVYRFVVNARTGKVSGERPYSAAKITGLVVLIIAVIAAIVVLVKMRGQ
ncbi:MAG: hypothetical protein H6711_27140 [Myxococcales bacterium]|nr:hypothetical protein [Myxococcales bacterium]